MRPLAERNESFILDTLDFLSKIGDVQVGEYTKFVTINVEAVYTMLPHDLCIKAAIKVYMVSRVALPGETKPTGRLLQLLGNNYVLFHHMYCQQKLEL